jgi:hypothetical protein
MVSGVYQRTATKDNLERQMNLELPWMVMINNN